jgi:outer membrane protein OmpA-like peptidoglycan-associated protein/tetratricopeptide (TPR) repeat protein
MDYNATGMRNMKRKYIILWILITGLAVAPQLLSAQKSKLSLAAGKMREFNYSTAAEIYEDILSNPKFEKDTAALRGLASCEMNLGRYASAEKHLRDLMTLNAANGSDMHLLAHSLKFQNKYADAVEIYRQILTQNPGDAEAQLYTSNPDFAWEIKRDSVIYLIQNEKQINSEQSDFAPGFFGKDKLIFSSARGMGAGAARNYAWNNQPYLNVYAADIATDSSLKNAAVLPNRLNTRYHEGSMSFFAQDSRMYLTRNNYFNGNRKKSKDGYLNLGIFSYKFENGEWGAEDAFVHNNSEYSVGHPALNRSNTRIYFVSDMPGGLGGTDIYYCEREGEVWGTPRNAGPAVNTPDDEMFPYVAGDSTLYFSSSGHIGLGGLDLFYIPVYDSTATARNLGYPANTHFDDFGVVVYPDETVGYFSSNRAGGMGDDDIYSFRVRPPEFVDVTGRVVEMVTLAPLRNADVMVEAQDGSLISVKTDDQGRYSVKAPYRKSIRIEAELEDYAKAGVDVLTNPRITSYKANDIMMKKVDILAQGTVVYDYDGSPAAGARVFILDEKGQPLDSTVVAANGSYTAVLPEGRKGSVEVRHDGYVKLTKPFDTGKLPKSKRKVENDFRLFKLEKGTVVRLDNIYYDYGKSDIRADAAFELDKLVQILQDNPTMSIELSSHTDSRGGDAYNLKLSDSRAHSAVKYMIGRGIATSRMVAKGYGETMLLNKCANNVKCSEEEHQFNRRTEFKILDF